MCEILVAAWPSPRPFVLLREWAQGLERFGLAGFGWGVAWLTGDGRVRVERGLGRFTEEIAGSGVLQVESTRFLVHLRRPSRLSTVQWADTQPFTAGGRYAFCHNGFFERAEQWRPRYEGRLAGGADSEVGWCFLQDVLAAGADPGQALGQVDQTFGGRVNLGLLEDTGRLLVYARNAMNPMWRFTDDDGAFATTSLHSDDTSVFGLVYPTNLHPVLLPVAEVVQVAGDLPGQRIGESPTAAPAAAG